MFTNVVTKLLFGMAMLAAPATLGACACTDAERPQAFTGRSSQPDLAPAKARPSGLGGKSYHQYTHSGGS